MPIENHGLVEATSGLLNLAGGTSPNTTANGIYRGTGAGKIVFSANSNTFEPDNGHQLQGSVGVSAGSLEGSPYLADGATLQMTAGAINGTVRGPGTLSVEGGTYSGDITAGGQRSWSAGTFTGNLTVAPGAILDLSGSTTKALGATVAADATLTVSTGATLRVNGGSLSMTCATSSTRSLSLVNHGVIELRAGTSPLTRSGATTCLGRTVVNDGTIQKQDSASVSAISVPIENHGLVTAISGPLNLGVGTAPNTTAGGIYRGVAPGQIVFAGGTHTFEDNGHQLQGDLVINSGTLAGEPYLAGDATLTLTGGGNVTGLVGGPGTFAIAGGTLWNDIVPGGPRLWSGGTITGDIDVRLLPSPALSAKGIAFDNIEGHFHDALGTYAELLLANQLIEQAKLAQTPFATAKTEAKLNAALALLPTADVRRTRLQREVEYIRSAAQQGAQTLLADSGKTLAAVRHTPREFANAHAGDVRLPPERFYWSILEAPGLGASRGGRAGEAGIAPPGLLAHRTSRRRRRLRAAIRYFKIDSCPWSYPGRFRPKSSRKRHANAAWRCPETGFL